MEVLMVAVPPLALAPADPRVCLLDQFMEPIQTGVSVGVEDRLEGGVPIFEGSTSRVRCWPLPSRVRAAHCLHAPVRAPAAPMPWSRC